LGGVGGRFGVVGGLEGGGLGGGERGGRFEVVGGRGEGGEGGKRV
jgi:hypothetical protein